MATGLYWCLILTECLSLVACSKCMIIITCTCVSAPTVSFNQTTPSYTVVCPGECLVFTCIISDVNSYWSGQVTDAIAHWTEKLLGNVNSATRELYNGYTVTTGLGFSLYSYINGTTAVVTATNEAVTVSMNGVSVGCSYSHQSNIFTRLTINIAG